MTSVGLRHFDLAEAPETVGEIGALVVSKFGKARPSRTNVGLRLGLVVVAGRGGAGG